MQIAWPSPFIFMKEENNMFEKIENFVDNFRMRRDPRYYRIRVVCGKAVRAKTILKAMSRMAREIEVEKYGR